MKIGLISDVHGDLKALNQALSLLKNRHHVDSIWCAGDLVGRGQNPNEVVARIVRGSIPTVLGNHDEFILTQQPLLEKLNMYWSETFQLLRSLPRTYRVRLEGRIVVMVHGTPRSNMESLPLTPGHQEQALEWLKKINAHILVTGHTHVPLKAQNQHGLVVNPGSLFDPGDSRRSSSESYGVLDVSAMMFQHYPLWN